jgi:cyclopropane fatty-acyl-phospholipid synthase-like methyltransferase
VSREFGIGSWKPESSTRLADGTPLFLWVVPKRPAREPDILFVPTREAVADHMLQLAGIRASDVVYDLGSGDGRIVNLAAQKYGARGVGIEIDPPLVEIARRVAREAGVSDRAAFIEADLFTADLSPATIVTVYLSPSVNRRLEPKLRQELRPGTRVVSHQFPIGDWTPDKAVRAEDGTELYLWTVR